MGRILKILAISLLGIFVGIAGTFIYVDFRGFRFISESAGMPFAIDEPAQDSGQKLVPLEDAEIRNIILFVGDGMGINQVELARYRYYGANGRLNMERMPFSALVQTKPAGNNLITDSAAGATAMATAKKTDNGMIAMTPDCVVSITLLEALQKRQWSAGLLTTSAITDATPAAFASHVPNRDMQHEIAIQMLDHRVDFLGGGRGGFEGIYPNQKMAIDKFAVKRGYSLAKNRSGLAALNDSLALVLFDQVVDDVTKYPNQANPDTPILKELTELAIKRLSRDSSFFLLVEEEGTDTGGHVNHADYLTASLKNLDDAVGSALDFAAKDGHTLVLVTADHETGGLTFNEGTGGKEVLLNWATTGHTGQSVPLFAYGPFAHRFSGKLDNTDIPKIIGDLLGLSEFR